MSTTATRRPYADALAGAEAFCNLFPPHAYERWDFAGSLRRQSREVGDVEHVVIPRFADVAGADLFATPARTNLLFHYADQLVASGKITKHLYANGLRWGGRYRGCDFGHSGAIVLHELFCADADNWGPMLAIRTGPADFSKRLVTGLRHRNHRNKDGYVWRCQPCADLMKREHPGELCKRCQGTGLEPVERVSVPDERAYLSLCGMAWADPEDRR